MPLDSGIPQRSIPSDLIEAAKEIAAKHGVAHQLSDKDFILWFLLDHAGFAQNKAGAIDYYFSNGRRSAERLNSIIGEHLARPSPSILEFASGYGCVTRHLPALMPTSSIVACDIHDEAVSFIDDEIGVDAISSVSVPEDFDAKEKFDVVFALSFFTHMPDATWQRWLNTLGRCLKPGGLLVFTANGHKAVPNFPKGTEVDEDGYFFLEHSEQSDLSPKEYGSTIALFPYIHRQLQKTRFLDLVKFEEAFWYETQDVYVLRANHLVEIADLSSAAGMAA